jgi:hypothetical protein
MLKFSKVENFGITQIQSSESVPVVCFYCPFLSQAVIKPCPLPSGRSWKTYALSKPFSHSASLPLILIIEDLQFADKLSLELFNRLVHPSNL